MSTRTFFAIAGRCSPSACLAVSGVVRRRADAHRPLAGVPHHRPTCGDAGRRRQARRVPAVRRAGPRRPDGQRRHDTGAHDLQRHRRRRHAARAKNPDAPYDADQRHHADAVSRRCSAARDGRNTPGVDVPLGFDGGIERDDQSRLAPAQVVASTSSATRRSSNRPSRISPASAGWDSFQPSLRSRSMVAIRTVTRSP